MDALDLSRTGRGGIMKLHFLTLPENERRCCKELRSRVASARNDVRNGTAC